MIITGLDPGTQRTGYAVIEERAGRLEIRDLGVWNLLSACRVSGQKERPSLGSRLECLHKEVHAFFSRWNPVVIGLEKAVTFRNIASAQTLSEARGVIRLAAHQVLSQTELRLHELSPTAVKRQAAGFGASTKLGVMKSLSLRFSNLEEISLDQNFSFDAFDALAIAYTAHIAWKQERRRGARPLRRIIPSPTP